MFKRPRKQDCLQSQVKVRLPSATVLMPGHYHLFLISSTGVPSRSVHTAVTNVLASQEGKRGLSASDVAAIVIMSLVAVAALGGFLVYRHRVSAKVRGGGSGGSEEEEEELTNGDGAAAGTSLYQPPTPSAELALIHAG